MKCVRIEVENVCGLEKLDIEPKALTVISGENGAGKTSVLSAIRGCLSEGHDPSLLRTGAARGVVRITLDDGSVLQKTITPEKSSFEGRHPKLGKVSRARAWVDGMVDQLGLDPLALLYAPDKQRAALLADLLVVAVSETDLEAAAGRKIGRLLPASVTGLDRIEAVRKALYDERTGLNKSGKDKRATAAQLRETLPPASEEAPNAAALREQKADLEGQRDATIRENERRGRGQLEGIRSNAQAEIDTVRADATERIRVLERERDEAIDRIKTRAQEQADETQAAVVAADKAAAAYAAPDLEALTSQVATAEAVEKEHARAEKTREILTASERDAEKAETESSDLTDALGRLDALRAALLASLPVKGLEIRDGAVYLDALPFERTNTARQMEVALEVARLRAKDLPLLVSDHGEALDDANWAALEQTAARLGMNVVVARRTEGPLSVRTLGAEEAAA